jgi:hypothetical protein
MPYPVLFHFILKLSTAIYGVIISVFITTIYSLPSYAQSIDIFATVPAPLPTSPAIITSVYNQEHVTEQSLIISGTCGDGTYVTLYDNGNLTGIGSCLNGTFDIQIQLVVGTNQLQTHIFNSTDNEGPLSTTVTIYLDSITESPAPTVEAALSLQVTSVENTPYTLGSTYKTSDHPTISGVAIPRSIITITYSPQGYLCKTTANFSGHWTCTLGVALPLDNSDVIVSSLPPHGVISRVPTFSISVVSAASPPIISGDTLILRYIYNYKIYHVGEEWQGEFTIDGGSPPYTVEVNWQDGKHSRYVQSLAGLLHLAHTYAHPGNYQPFIHITDSHNSTTSLQVLVVVENDRPLSEQINNRPSRSSTPILISTGIVVIVATVAELFGATQLFRIGKIKK